MEIRFNRSEISFINNIQKNSAAKDKNNQEKEKVAIPSEESFAYILNKAKSGNEMAAVQIDEWSKFCRPSNNREKFVVNQIKKAVDEIFE